jgi:SWI/SNF-related matrix-associated actin-dependent regulator 1 of chromatin subfamily A
MVTIPYNFQRDDVMQITRWKGRVLLANEQGTGKTLESLYWVHKNPTVRPVVVVCPPSVTYNWQREAFVHFGLKSTVIEGRKVPKEKTETEEIIILGDSVLDAWVGYLISISPKLLVIDECHRCKSRTTKRTRAAKTLARSCPHVLALSGTPLTSRPSELFPVLNMVRPDLYPNFHLFADTHCPPRRTPWGMDYSGAANIDLLHRKLSSTMMIRRRKADVLKELPEMIRQVCLMKIDKPKEYQEAERDFKMWLQKTNPLKVAKSNMLAKVGFLLRMAAQKKLSSVKEWIHTFLDSSDEKLIVFGVHKAMLGALQKEFPDSLLIDGSVTGKNRQVVVDQFQNGPKRLLFGNLIAAGVGITLTAASTTLMAEMTWVPADMLQAEARTHRIGQRGQSVAVYAVALGTIEEKLVNVLVKKQGILSGVLDGGKGEGLDVLSQVIKEMSL